MTSGADLQRVADVAQTIQLMPPEHHPEVVVASILTGHTLGCTCMVCDFVRGPAERHDVGTLNTLIEVAHEQRRQLDDAGWRDEVMTLAQHWSATAGWLGSRIRAIECGDDPDMPDAMTVWAKSDCEHDWMLRPESDTYVCLACGAER